MRRPASSATHKAAGLPRASARTRRRVASTGVAVLLLAAGAAAAVGAPPTSPRFARPRQIVASTPNVPSAVSGAGEALTLRPGSGPGPALQLASAHGRVRTVQLSTTVSGYNHPSVAIADSGALAATWDTSSTTGSSPDVVEMAVGSFGAPPTTATVLSTPAVAASGEQVFVTPAGAAVVVWNQAGGAVPTVRAAVVPPGRTPQPVTIAANETLVGGGLDGRGDVVLIEQDGGALTQQTISADGSVVGRTEDFIAPQAVSDAAGVAGELGVLVDATGDQLFSWRPLGARQELYAVWRSASGTFGAIQALGVTADVGGDGPEVALNSSGHAAAVLTTPGTGPLRVRFASALSHFGPVARVGVAGRYADMPVITINGSGSALVAWVDSPPHARGTTKSQELVAESRGSRFTPTTLLPVGPGLGARYLGDAPITTAAPGGKPVLVTYGASRGSRAVGQIVFVTG